MAQVTVAYDDLESSAAKLGEVKTYLDGVSTQIASIASEIEALGSKHDNCFSKTLDALSYLDKDFKNYSFEVEFLINQCNAAATAFKEAENESVELTAAMKAVIGDLLIMTGNPNDTKIDELSMSDIERASTSDSITADIYNGTITERSETWNNIFIDADADSLYEATNAKLSKGATSIIEPDPGPTPPPDDPNPGGPGGPGGPSGGDPYITYTPTPTLTPTPTPTPTEDPITPTPTEEPTSTPTPTPTVEPTPSPTEEPVPTPSPTPTPVTTPVDSTVEVHVGGGGGETSSGTGYVPYEPESDYTPSTSTSGTENVTEGIPEEVEEEIIDDDIIDDNIDTIVTGDDISKIAVNEPIVTKKSSGSTVIPIAAGLSAAAAAGLGAKAYMDRKKNNSDDSEEFESEDWNGDESTDFEYGDSATKEEYLDDDDYIASEDTNETEKYGARNNEELADLQ